MVVGFNPGVTAGNIYGAGSTEEGIDAIHLSAISTDSGIDIIVIT
jgi:hypothetical protein